MKSIPNGPLGAAVEAIIGRNVIITGDAGLITGIKIRTFLLFI